MTLVAELVIFSGARNPSWIVPEPIGGHVREQAPFLADGRDTRIRGYVGPNYPTESGYRGILISRLEDFLEWRVSQKHTAVPFRWPIAPIDDPDQRLARRLFDSMPAPNHPIVGLTFDALTAASHGPYPIQGLEGTPVATALVCSAAPAFPTGDELTMWNDSMANCYSYANDMVDDPRFFTPGPGSFQPTTEGPLRQTIKTYDRLGFKGMSEPRSCLTGNGHPHFVVVCMRSLRADGLYHDFHCLRLDRDGFWSHRDTLLQPVQRITTGPSLFAATFPQKMLLAGFFKSADGTRVID